MNKTAPAVPATAWRVRFLSGALRGRIIGLKPGPNVLGSAGDCDIMLPGDVLPRHLIFTVGDIAVTVQKFGTAAARVNGEDLALQRRTVVSEDIISVGGIDFELGRNENRNEVRKGAETSDADAGAEHLFEGPETAPPPADPTLAPAGQPRYRRGAVVAAIVAVAAISTGFGLRAFENPNHRLRVGNASTVEAAELRRAVADFSEVDVTVGANGKAAVRGYVLSSARKAALRQALQRFGNDVVITVHVTDEIVEQARRYLGDPAVSVTYAGRGRLVIAGTTASESLRGKVKRLGDDLHPAVAVLDQLQYDDGGSGPAADPAAALSAWQRTLPSPMVGVTEYPNGLRQIQLANGRRYYEGSTLKSGDELTRIEADRLEITNAGSAKKGPAVQPPERQLD